MPRARLDAWNHFKECIIDDKWHSVCNYCQKIFLRPNVKILRVHLAVCKLCPDHIKVTLQKLRYKKSKRKVITSTSKLLKKPAVESLIETGMDLSLPQDGRISGKEIPIRNISTSVSIASKGTGSNQITETTTENDTGASKDISLSGHKDDLLRAQATSIEKGKALTPGTDFSTNVSASFLSIIIERNIDETGYPTIIQQPISKFQSSEICKIVNEIGPHNCTAFITDNTKTMKASWTEVCSKYPHIACIPCTAHCFNRILNDIMDLEHLKETFCLTETITNDIRSNDAVLAYLEKIQNEIYGNSYNTLRQQIPINMKWVQLLTAMKLILTNRKALERTALSKELEIDSKIRNIILNEDTWLKISDTKKIFLAICNVIKYKIHNMLLSDVPVMFDKLLKMFTESLSKTDCLVSNEKKKILRIIKRRRKFSLKPIHYASHLLDPRFIGEKLDDAEFLLALEYISSVAKILELDVGQCLAEVAEYRAKSGFWSSSIIWIPLEHLEPRLWWRGICSNKKISVIALRILNVPALAQH